MNASVHYKPDILCCPRCQGPLDTQPDALACTPCCLTFTLHNGIPLLLTENSPTTKLTEIDYDLHHGIDDTSRESVGLNWATVLPGSLGDVLELGAGTGQLSWNLAHRFNSRSVHITDIALAFVESTQALVGASRTPVFYYACDANRLPFTDGSFDTVVGNSVLHHFLDYPDILKRIHGLLRPGGRAVFYEPVLQGKIMVAFLTSLILRMEAQTALGGLDPHEINALEKLVQHITKAKTVGDDREKLAQMEDKYIFDIHALETLGKSLDFQAVHYQNSRLPDGLFKINLRQHLLLAGLSETKIKPYKFILNAYKEILIDLLPQDQVTPMGFFTFSR